MTRREWLTKAEQRLEAAGIADAAWDAFSLLSHVTGISRLDYSLEPAKHIEEEKEGILAEALAKREARIPLQQITGQAWLMGYPFFVNADVLIPRMDTEVLIEAVLERCGREHFKKDGISVLDLCTGSGCILISLMKEDPAIAGTGSDISEKALLVAEKNAKALQVAPRFIKSDLFEHIKGRYDVIVSNPPYIASGVIAGLDPEVKDHEPLLALDGGEDGLDLYRRILKEAGDHLHKGGLLAFEIGYDQGEALRRLFYQHDFTGVEIIKDLAGLDRVALGFLKE